MGKIRVTKVANLNFALDISNSDDVKKKLLSIGLIRTDWILTSYVRSFLKQQSLNFCHKLVDVIRSNISSHYYASFNNELSVLDNLSKLVEFNNLSSTSRWALEVKGGRCYIFVADTLNVNGYSVIDEIIFATFISDYLPYYLGLECDDFVVHLCGKSDYYSDSCKHFRNIEFSNCFTGVSFLIDNAEGLPKVENEEPLSLPFSELVVAAINTCLVMELKASVDNVAFLLGMSSKSVQRELSRDKLKFMKIVKDVRFALVERKLDNVVLKNISLEVSPNSINNFYRDYKKYRQEG
ncbi:MULTISPECIES: hypothetical protein [unclassified Shewanella]|uniref:hypothetical protein n=1 Tax=unclassified Shewanella TaxID=196818 RepID=UPI001BB94234|nr:MULTISPECIES: hypothetical protein [unclassified Shewanella]GIU11319.1 hypothetical protein TUM4444_17030 [Shewanella sp. MBTL60-112-B1]GIU31025.1 hypothetical protein TUM4445_15010 [Shewanella sp. MBTL60-112-B2]